MTIVKQILGGFFCSPGHHEVQGDLCTCPRAPFHLALPTGTRILLFGQAILVSPLVWTVCLFACFFVFLAMFGWNSWFCSKMVFCCDISWAACREGSSQSRALPTGTDGSWQVLGRERSQRQEWWEEEGLRGWRKATAASRGGSCQPHRVERPALKAEISAGVSETWQREETHFGSLWTENPLVPARKAQVVFISLQGAKHRKP